MATCPNGHPNLEVARFCEVCGLQLGTSPTPDQVAFGFPGQDAGLVFPGAPPSARKGWVLPVIIIGAVLGVVALGVVALRLLASPSTTTVYVNVTILDIDGCDVGLGYYDVPGSTVSVLADGVFAGSARLSEIGDPGALGCTFSAWIPDVPTDASVYTMDGGDRGEITNTRSELEGNDWAFEASLG